MTVSERLTVGHFQSIILTARVLVYFSVAAVCCGDHRLGQGQWGVEKYVTGRARSGRLELTIGLENHVDVEGNMLYACR